MSFVPLGTTAAARDNETILDVARRAGAPLGNSCGGIGVCARCKVRLIDGRLSPPTSMEERFGKLGDGERLACQAVITEDCSVTTTYW